MRGIWGDMGGMKEWEDGRGWGAEKGCKGSSSLWAREGESYGAERPFLWGGGKFPSMGQRGGVLWGRDPSYGAGELSYVVRGSSPIWGREGESYGAGGALLWGGAERPLILGGGDF